MNVNVSDERIRHPKEKANFLSKVTFFYNLGIIWDTFKTGTFKKSQLHEVLRECKAETSGNELENCMKKDNTRLSITRILWQCYGVKYLLLGIIQLLARSIVIITIPLTLSKVVLYFQPGQTVLTKPDAILFASLLIIVNFLSITYLHNYLLTLSELGIRIRTAMCSVIFRKCMKISSTALSDLSTGKVVTLMTKDVTAIETFVFYCNDTWIGILQSVIVFYLIYAKMGFTTFIGFGFFVGIIPIQILIGKITSKLRMKSSEKTDERLQTTKETLSGIGIIKMNNWEDVFREKVNKSRKIEMTTILKTFLTKISVLLIGSLTSKIAFYLLLTSYVLLGNSISAELIYYVTTLFLRIRHALNIAIPVGVTVIAEMNASVRRIEHLMTSEEISVPRKEIEDQKKYRLSLIDVSVEINHKKIIDNVALNTDCALVIISGPIGSGKSTLLKAILGEYELLTGKILKDGIISYASQEPWIFPSSLKQNIIFDEDLDEERYRSVLEICALNFDLQHNSLGDNIKIGDKGANLSKGQKIRINLARAVYKKADIYLLDDPLSSLDTHVQKHVFQKCIKEFLADKICIFITQNLQFIDEGDKVVLMDEGRIIFTQKLKDNKNLELKTFLKNEKRFEELVEFNNNIEEDLEKVTESSVLLKDVSQKKDNLYDENIKSGKVDFIVYQKYCSYGGGFVMIVILFIFFVGTQFSKSYTEKILSNWVNFVHQNSTSKNNNTSTGEHLTDMALLLYSIFTLSTTVFSIVSAFLLFNFSRKASLNLHKCMIESILNASMKFFDSHLIGNILNRFSKDLNIIDEQIPFAIYEFLEIFFGLLGIVILIAMVNVIFLVPTITVFVILYFLRKLYMPIGRNLQRLDTTTRSPVIGYLNSALEGLITIRAFKAEKILIREFDKHQDLNTSASFTSKCCETTFGYYLDVCCTIFIGVIIGTFLIFDKETSVGDVGLAITQAFMLTGIVQYGIRKWTEIENKMTSTERVLEYINIDEEMDDPNGVYTGWPKENSIEFKKVYFGYEDNKEYVLRNINLVMGENAKVGVVGRTGSGKSTLVSLLFRLHPYEGTISVGGLDIKNIPLKVLRSNISIISQDPVLFTGTVRTNFDPKNQKTDEEIWSVIQKIHLQNLLPSLDFHISECGSNFSAGQRQLICLARCLLTENKIIILDEATSDMDMESEYSISKILDEHFKDCTLILIVHRLRTVLNCDRVAVVQEGEIVEYEEVNVLRKDVNGIFYGMLENSGLL